jgi:hypothetical protein
MTSDPVPFGSLDKSATNLRARARASREFFADQRRRSGTLPRRTWQTLERHRIQFTDF